MSDWDEMLDENDELRDKWEALVEEYADAALAEILRKDRWIIDGNFSRTLERRLAECDTVFLFDLPLADCIAVATEF